MTRLELKSTTNLINVYLGNSPVMLFFICCLFVLLLLMLSFVEEDNAAAVHFMYTHCGFSHSLRNTFSLLFTGGQTTRRRGVASNHHQSLLIQRLHMLVATHERLYSTMMMMCMYALVLSYHSAHSQKFD